MSSVLLIRHGQAGTRDHYDSLSERGRTQARLLGEYLASEKLEFTTVISGALRRQQETAEQVAAAYQRAGLVFPEVTVDQGWNEFDFDDVYRGVAPLLAADDDAFRLEYEELLARIKSSGGDAESEVHRRWTPCDVKVFQTWVAGRYPYAGESWEGFVGRISQCTLATEGNVIVFTSATPTAIRTAQVLGVNGANVMRLAGALYNTAITEFRVRDGQMWLFSFNGIPHLRQSVLRTHR